MQEIAAETAEQDNALVRTTRPYRKRLLAEAFPLTDATTTTCNTNNTISNNETHHDRNDVLSCDAMKLLDRMTQCPRISDKLFFCVKFIEQVASHQSQHQLAHGQKMATSTVTVCADSLLVHVCQHILVATAKWATKQSAQAQQQEHHHHKHYGLHAQLVFLQEFCSDELLLHGSTGYSFVTIQAALQFLHTAHPADLEMDVLALWVA